MVMGITDVDDKIIRRANEIRDLCLVSPRVRCPPWPPWKRSARSRDAGVAVGAMSVSPASLARLYEEDFKQDMAALKVLPPTAYLRVTEHVPQIVAFIERLIANGHAYCTAKGNVYFDLQSRGDRYGKLVGVAPGPVGEPVDSDKRHTSDFALWKAAKPQEPFWGSPWGDGRPGWHIECSTIASLVFGSQLDIHSGGVDLAFPHHENEIAQCEAFHQCPQWGNYFLHSGHLHVKGGGEKMSKSLKNYVTIKDFLRSTSPDVFRLFCLRSSYRSAIDYSEGALLEARSLLRATAAFVEDARAYLRGQLAGGPIQEDVLWERLGRTKAAVQAALADDFDTVQAVDAVMDLVHHGNRQLKAASESCFGTSATCQHVTDASSLLCSRGRQPGRPAQPGGGAGPLPAEGPPVRSGLRGGPWGGAAAAAPGAAAPAGGLRRATQGPGRPWHQHQGQERLVHMGAAGSEDRRPQTQELRTGEARPWSPATVLHPLSHSKAFM
ncbi:probable cysteine--tRNA ligase, mitochondrial isoform X4 [Bos indicus x Bos taurus]|uniref:probable cysteine--tRNA ligase, mitochondrial isoform X4 n=1 Tax=Bos indicus x Bos taurus TaxID=30522 RepID=UPI000F7D353A|nr:probable cysteine--tRNA ligase, mitochondrial isoform X4 [Bos indicus x Bos taurus]